MVYLVGFTCMYKISFNTNSIIFIIDNSAMCHVYNNKSVFVELENFSDNSLLIIIVGSATSPKGTSTNLIYNE